MRQLILFRHGKSDWDANFTQDHERPVAKRGVKAAKTMGQVLTRMNQVPDAVVTSSAVRAKTTAELAKAAGRWDCSLRVTDALYEASPQQILDVVQAESDSINTLLLVGHQPTWSQFGAALVGGGTLSVPTAAMVCIGLDIKTWTTLEFGIGSLQWLLPPKLFTKGTFPLD